LLQPLESETLFLQLFEYVPVLILSLITSTPVKYSGFLLAVDVKNVGNIIKNVRNVKEN